MQIQVNGIYLVIKKNKIPTKKVGSFVYAPKNLIDKIFDRTMKELLKTKVTVKVKKSRIPKRMVHLFGKLSYNDFLGKKILKEFVSISTEV